MSLNSFFHAPTNQRHRLSAGGSPVIEHRPLQICHIPGGGMWGIKSSVEMDFLSYLTGQPFAHHFDAYSAVSVGSILAASILLPKHAGSTEPLHHDFKTLRQHIAEDGAEIFPAKKSHRFLLRRALRELKRESFRQSIAAHRILSDLYLGGVEKLGDAFNRHATPPEGQFPTATQGMCRHLGKLVTAFHGLQHGTAMKIRAGQDSYLNELTALTEEKVHFKGSVLLEKLWGRLRTPRTINSDETIPVSMRQMIAPLIIPTTVTTGQTNGHRRFIRTPEYGQTIVLGPRQKPWFCEDYLAAGAVNASSRQPAMFTTYADPENGEHYSDGGSFYDAFQASLDTLKFWSTGQVFHTTVYDCNMGDRPPHIKSNELNNSVLPAIPAKLLALQARSLRHTHDRDLEDMPNNAGLIEFKRPVFFDAPPLQNRTVKEHLEEFAQAYLGVGLADCLDTKIPDPLDHLTQANASPEMIDLYKKAGMQAIWRNLPEMVEHAQYLLTRGPLADRLPTAEITARLENIEHMFPAIEMAAIKSARVWDKGTSAEINGPYMTPEERVLFERKRDRLLRQGQCPQAQTQEFAPEK